MIADFVRKNLPDWRQNISDFVWNNLSDWQQEYMITSAENPKHEVISTALYAASTFDPITGLLPGRMVGLMPGSHVAYHFCRRVDDISDGDYPLPTEYQSFPELVTDLKGAMESEKYPKSDLGILLRGTVRDLWDYRRFDIREGIGEFLDAMSYENKRRLNRVISTQAELSELYKNSFGVPQDIAFISAASRIRSNDVPELAQLQGRAYAVRDLTEELQKGIIFIPREAIPNSTSIDELCNDPYSIREINDWIQGELIDAQKLIGILKSKKLGLKARAIVGSLTWGIRKYIEKESEDRL